MIPAGARAISWLPDALYGAANLKTTPETAAWFQIWSLLTHGQTRASGTLLPQQEPTTKCPMISSARLTALLSTTTWPGPRNWRG